MAYHFSAYVQILMIVINVIFVALRSWTRFTAKAPWQYADILVPLSFSFNLTLASLFLTMDISSGYTKTIPGRKMAAFWVPVVYAFANTLPKLAILDIYNHIFFHVRWAYRTIQVVTFILVGNAVAYIIATLCNCRPLAFTWDKSMKGQCGNTIKLYSMSSIPNIVTDVAIILIPIPIILKLQMSKRVKFGVLTTFLVGTIGLAASIARFAFFINIKKIKSSGGRLDISTTCEVTCYLISACVLHMRPLIDTLILRFKSTIRAASSYGSTNPKSTTKITAPGSGKRHTFQHTNESEGDLIEPLPEGDPGIYVLKTIAVHRTKQQEDV
ncbi:hypothetical protein BDV95DRAFT_575160 [Massariosphaeria phaeospora]|uniref:Rhodopsin domain-containing protein n=1 Tax=Massariosphaeria phaeospora TaxID=100035 RepID=A0A7C8MLX0_9PLEO|nr:hypothetical protein BDV95DRAFT_575160 [Massariosphaeria phaeospora]